MAKNYLFNFIKSKLLTQQPPGLTLNDNAEDESRYLDQELPVTRKAIAAILPGDNPLRLQQHRIQFHDRSDFKSRNKAQYSYVADLLDQQGKRYRLNVDLNDRDQVCAQTELVEIIANEPPKIIHFESSLLLEKFAIENLAERLSMIKSAYNETIAKLFNEYATIDDRLAKAAKEFPCEPDSYVAIMQEAITAMSALNELDDFEDFLTMLHAIQKILTKKPSFTDIPLNDDETSGNETRYALRLINEVKNAQQVYLKYSDTTNSFNHVVVFYRFQKAVLNLQESKLAVIELQDVVLIPLWHYFIEKEGKRLVQQCLISNKYDFASLLRRFMKSVDNNIVKMALTKNNAKLLEFLLSHGLLSIMTKVKQDLGPLQYCVALQNSEAINILMKYTANILLSYQELPIAYHLYENTCLRDVIIDNLMGTLEKTSFCMGFIQALRIFQIEYNFTVSHSQVKSMLTQLEQRVARQLQLDRMLTAPENGQPDLFPQVWSKYTKTDIIELTKSAIFTAIGIQIENAIRRYIRSLSPEDNKCWLDRWVSYKEITLHFMSVFDLKIENCKIELGKFYNLLFRALSSMTSLKQAQQRLDAKQANLYKSSLLHRGCLAELNKLRIEGGAYGVFIGTLFSFDRSFLEFFTDKPLLVKDEKNLTKSANTINKIGLLKNSMPRHESLTQEKLQQNEHRP